MSLFKARDLWKTTCGQNEIFDSRSLLTVDIWSRGNDYLVVGSHDGLLRIFNPFADSTISINERGFSPSDLVIEIDLGQPILQIAAGRFISGSKTSSLAILHPRSFGVYNCTTIAGSAEHGDQTQVFMVYEHHLKRSAFQMVTGGFGGVDGRDFVCVLGLDGTLMFYEQETHILTKSLPNFLLPYPIVYVPHTDSFITINCNWCLESFRYQILGEESSEKPTPSWSYNLGESVNDLLYHGVTTTEAAIFVLTDWNFYCFNEIGVMKFCKRLQFSPLCCTIFSKGEPTIMSLIATDSKTLMVYEGTTLKWSAQFPNDPVAIRRCNLAGLAGCVVLLTEDGDLSACYMGTEPAMFVPPQLQENLLPTVEVETKLQTLQHQIATFSQSARNSLGAPMTRPDLKLSLKVWPMLEGESACNVEISIQTTPTIYNLHVSVIVTHPLIAIPNSHTIQSFGDEIELNSKISVLECRTVPWDLEANVLAIYHRSDMTCNSCESSIRLPPQLVLELSSPSKENDVSLSLSTSQSVILPTIFPEFAPDSWNTTGSNELCAGFKYKKQPDVSFTMYVNKSQLKYRIESNTSTALTLPLNVLSHKIDNKNLKTSQHSIALNELLDATERNVELRNGIRILQGKLKVGTTQMVAVQKRLLSKMRDKTPTDLTHLFELVSYTNEYVMRISHEIEVAQNDLKENCTRLNNLVVLTTMLVGLTGSANLEVVKQFSEALLHTEYSSESQGWAEASEAALNFLLRTCLARSVREQYMTPFANGSVVSNPSNLKKYIAAAVERLVKNTICEERGVTPILEGEEDGPSSGNFNTSRPTLYEDFDAEVQKLVSMGVKSDTAMSDVD